MIRRDFGSVGAWRDDLQATGMAGRGWAWTAYDWDERRLFNSIGDAQNTYPIWNATPLVALDVYEHAYFLDFQTDRGAYIDAFFANLDWRSSTAGSRPTASPRRNLEPMIDEALIVAGGYLVGSIPFGVVLVRLFRGEDIRAQGVATSARRTCGARYGRWLGVPVALLDVAKGFVPASDRAEGGRRMGRCAGRDGSDARPCEADLARVRERRQDGRDRGGVTLALAPLAAAIGLLHLAGDVRAVPVRVARVARHGRRRAGALRGIRRAVADGDLRDGRGTGRDRAPPAEHQALAPRHQSRFSRSSRSAPTARESRRSAVAGRPPSRCRHA